MRLFSTLVIVLASLASLNVSASENVEQLVVEALTEGLPMIELAKRTHGMA